VHDHLGDETKEEVLDQAKGEARLGPVVAPFEDLQHVAIELNLAVEVLFLEGLNGNLLLAVVCVAVLGLGELQVVLDGLAGQLSLLVLAGSELGGEPPEWAENGKGQNQSEEDPGLEAHAPAVGDVGGDTDEQGDEGGVAERLATGAFCREGGIGNGRVLLGARCQFAGFPSRVSMARGGVRGVNLVATYRSRLHTTIEGRGNGRGRRRRLDPLEILFRGIATHFAHLAEEFCKTQSKDVEGFGRRAVSFKRKLRQGVLVLCSLAPHI
jgi:hypothetical protein